MFLQCLTALVMGGNGLSRPDGNLGLNQSKMSRTVQDQPEDCSFWLPNQEVQEKHNTQVPEIARNTAQGLFVH